MDIDEEKQKMHKQIISRLKQNELLIERMLEIALKSIEIFLQRNYKDVDAQDDFHQRACMSCL